MVVEVASVGEFPIEIEFRVTVRGVFGHHLGVAATGLEALREAASSIVMERSSLDGRPGDAENELRVDLERMATAVGESIIAHVVECEDFVAYSNAVLRAEAGKA